MPLCTSIDREARLFPAALLIIVKARCGTRILLFLIMYKDYENLKCFHITHDSVAVGLCFGQESHP